jgi:DNA-binding MarR family transcriptional regulator
MQIFWKKQSMAYLTLEDCVADRSPGRLLRRISRSMWPVVEDRFADADISFVQWIALKTVHEDIVSTAGALARDLEITTGATTRLIDSLEERGLMVRDRGTEDRRVVRLEVTPAGYAKVMEVAPLVVATWNEILAGFTDEEVDQTVELLTKLLHAVQATAARHAEAPEAVQ